MFKNRAESLTIQKMKGDVPKILVNNRRRAYDKRSIVRAWTNWVEGQEYYDGVVPDLVKVIDNAPHSYVSFVMVQKTDELAQTRPGMLAVYITDYINGPNGDYLSMDTMMSIKPRDEEDVVRAILDARQKAATRAASISKEKKMSGTFVIGDPSPAEATDRLRNAIRRSSRTRPETATRTGHDGGLGPYREGIRETIIHRDSFVEQYEVTRESGEVEELSDATTQAASRMRNWHLSGWNATTTNNYINYNTNYVIQPEPYEHEAHDNWWEMPVTEDDNG